jgi:cysteine desulfurase
MSYFDNNATTPLHPKARQALLDASTENWANPSSPYRISAKVRASMQLCRESIASSLDTESDQITFTSGSTEANNSVFSNLARTASSSSRVLLSPYEHPSVSEAAHHWFADRVDYLGAQPDGTVSTDDLEACLSKEPLPALVSILAASNESGVIQPWREAARICRKFGVPYHCDSTQLPGKENLSELSLCSYSVFSAHKFGGPKGLGWLVGAGASSLLVGGEQEKGRRGGTENFPAIASAYQAWESVVQAPIDTAGLANLRDNFEDQMEKQFPGIRIIGKSSPRLWNTSLLIMPEFENLRWVGKLDKLGFQVSTGSACSTNKSGGSPIAQALDLSTSETQRLIRVSSFHGHTRSDWEGLVSAFAQAYASLKEESTDSSVISL